MNLAKKAGIGMSVLSSRILGRRMPIFVSWSLTNRCNMHCKYCEIPTQKSKELTTNQIIQTIEELARLGTGVIAFTGGEPLLRDDIGKIVDYAKDKGTFVKINSNGALVKDKIQEIRNADILQLSLDGPKGIHNRQRGKGSYDRVMEAVQIAKTVGMKVYFNTTITRFNVNHLDYISRKAMELRIPTSFQPVTDIFFGAKNVAALYPERGDFILAINKLKQEKKRNPYILNSQTSLEYMSDWPRGGRINCFAGRINYRIASDGNILPCNRTMDRKLDYNCLRNLREVFKRDLNAVCPGCWCITALELNYVFSFQLEPILNLARLDFLK